MRLAFRPSPSRSFAPVRPSLPLVIALVVGSALLTASVGAGAVVAKKKKPAAPAPTVNACNDFYTSVNSAWLKAHPVPAGAASASRWDELNAEADGRSRELLARTSAASGAASGLLADIVASASDNAGLDAAAHAAAQPLLAQIDAIRKPRDVIKAVAALHAAGAPVLFGFDALRDPESGQPRATFYPGGLGLPDPAYYGAVSPELQRAVDLYKTQLGELLRFAGVPEAKVAEQAASAWALEQALAQSMGGTSSDSMLVAQLAKSYPSLSLPEFMQGQGTAPSAIRLQQPGFFRALDTTLAKPSIPQWQAYLRAQLVLSLAPAMARDPRLPWLQALGASAGATPSTADRLLVSRLDGAELFSAAYAESWLPREDQQRAQAIAESLRAAMGRAIERASWLSPSGRAEASRKLAALDLAIGKPVDPAAFTGLHFDRRSYAGNLMALRRWNKDRALARLSSAVYPWPVGQSQPIIGYQAAQNRLIVTAASLRPPAFDRSSPAAEYGSFGALLGQQLALAFADFTGDDGRALAARQAPLLAQFDAYTASGTIMVNGLRTQRQNSADLAGLELAWDAFNAQGAPDPAAGKAFFHAWASAWARNDSPAAIAQAQAQSVFAPAKWRVDGPASNLPDFARTHACKPGQPMVRAAKDQAAIWR
jgi:putative endopeptidase